MTKLTPFRPLPPLFGEREADPRNPTTIHGYTLDLPANGPIRIRVDAENREGVRREVEITVPTGGQSR